MSIKVQKEILLYQKFIEKEFSVINSFYNISIKKNKEIFITPSGIKFSENKYSYISKIDFNNNLLNGKKQSVDSPFHIAIYKNFNFNCIIHAHLKYLCIWAQAEMPIPRISTTHADYFKKSIPITKKIGKKENFDTDLSDSIVECINNYNQSNLPGILIANHGCLAFGQELKDTFNNLKLMEFIAETAYKSLQLKKKINVNIKLYNYHFKRKNGKNKSYGQF